MSQLHTEYVRVRSLITREFAAGGLQPELFEIVIRGLECAFNVSFQGSYCCDVWDWFRSERANFPYEHFQSYYNRLLGYEVPELTTRETLALAREYPPHVYADNFVGAFGFVGASTTDGLFSAIYSLRHQGDAFGVRDFRSSEDGPLEAERWPSVEHFAVKFSAFLERNPEWSDGREFKFSQPQIVPTQPGDIASSVANLPEAKRLAVRAYFSALKGMEDSGEKPVDRPHVYRWLKENGVPSHAPDEVQNYQLPLVQDTFTTYVKNGCKEAGIPDPLARTPFTSTRSILPASEVEFRGRSSNSE
jgi:hypothetical protein